MAGHGLVMRHSNSSYGSDIPAVPSWYAEQYIVSCCLLNLMGDKHTAAHNQVT